jgi:hypothetical protein
VIVAVCGLAGVLVPLLLARGGDSEAPAPAPPPEEATTPVVEATAEPESAADVAPQLELLDRRAVTAGASSTLAPDAAGNRYDAALAIDGDTGTAWSEGVAGSGVGESIEFAFAGPVDLAGVELVNGYAKSRGLYRRNGRVSQVVVLTAQGSLPSVLRDGRLDFQPVRVRAGRTDFARIVVDGVFGGERHADTLISEVRFSVAPGD